MPPRNEDEATRAKRGATIERTSDRELVVTRIVDAPARLVFEAFSKPELFRRWWIPRSLGMTLVSCEMDVRTGGSYRLEIKHPASPEPMAFFGRYLEVIPDSRIVWTNEESDTGPVTTVTFAERGGSTTVVVHELHPSKEALDAAGTGAAEAMGETFTQLEELLAERAAGR